MSGLAGRYPLVQLNYKEVLKTSLKNLINKLDRQ